MIFSSTLFLLIFLPVTLAAYYIIPGKFLYARNIFLLFASLFFYAWGEPVVIWVMILSIMVNYIMAIAIESNKSKVLLWSTIAFNIGLLVFFKYTNFIVYNINELLGLDIKTSIVLPIGISFFTFQILSYVLDVYWANVVVQKDPLKLALYISLFPQLIAGPIVRYMDVEKSINKRKSNICKTAYGIRRFTIGLAKKVLIANQTAQFADHVFNMEAPPLIAAWVGAICYTLQIYFDFSGYSDMAIGLGAMFGFDFLENFNYPYASRSVKTFWRRWHISLSSWFRDYLYIPLGGSRNGNTYRNLIIVFAATGLWHGANWTFVIWGLYHGIFLIIERLFLGKILDKLHFIIGWTYTMFTVILGWVIFRSDNIVSCLNYISYMFNFKQLGFELTIANFNIITFSALICGIVFSFPVVPYLKRRFEFIDELNFAGVFFNIAILILSIVFLTGADFNPFLYFRF